MTMKNLLENKPYNYANTVQLIGKKTSRSFSTDIFSNHHDDIDEKKKKHHAQISFPQSTLVKSRLQHYFSFDYRLGGERSAREKHTSASTIEVINPIKHFPLQTFLFSSLN